MSDIVRVMLARRRSPSHRKLNFRNDVVQSPQSPPNPSLSMERLIDDYRQISAKLKVHNRAAGNILEQLQILSRASLVDRDETNLRSTLQASNVKLQELASLSPLRCYLRQGEITNALDPLIESCSTVCQSYKDDLIKEDIEAHREIYDSDRRADSVNLRRLLRGCLRQHDVLELIKDLTGDEINSLQDAVKLEVSLSHGSPDLVQLYQKFQMELEPLQSSKTRGLQDLTGRVVRISRTPLAWGATAIVWTGELYGKRVILHSSSNQYKPSSESVAVLRESMAWATFDHPHVLALLGIYRNFHHDLHNHGVALVSPYMENGTVVQFVAVNPTADRLKLITDIASGLAYLHSRDPPYAHGLLTGNGVLVDSDQNAVVGGFASATFEQGWMTPLRWLAPELSKRNLRLSATLPGDLFSFAMTTLEIMTGQIPYENVRSPLQIIDMVGKGERPARPDRKLIHHGLDDKLWDLISRCWAQDPGVRPSMIEVLRELEKMRELPDLDVRDLSGVVSLIDDVISIFASGGFGDIRRGIMKDFGPVALKALVLRRQTQPVLRMTKRFLREAKIWSSLSHKNILPFLGTADVKGVPTCLVSPWMKNSNCFDYLAKHPEVPPLPIALGITRGLSYLHAHDPPVIHGDLRGANVLIDDYGEPLLCDFGLAVVVEDLTQLPISSALEGTGNPRWMAPELLIGEEIVSQASDIWSLGMVFLEILTLDIPFRELKNYPIVILAIHKSGRPSRPTEEEVEKRGLSEDMWALMERCWAQSASDRPPAPKVLTELEALNKLRH